MRYHGRRPKPTTNYTLGNGFGQNGVASWNNRTNWQLARALANARLVYLQLHLPVDAFALMLP